MPIILIFLLKTLTILIVLQRHRIDGSTNVAHGKQTYSTDPLKSQPQWNSAKTVDGNTEQNLYCGSCLHTQQKNETEIHPVFLRVDFGKIYTINRIEIYFARYTSKPCGNRTEDEEVKKRSVKYEVKVSTLDSEIVCHQDNTTMARNFNLTQNKTCFGTGRNISIIQRNKSNGKGVTGPILEICEFKVFGCEKGKYGPHCEYSCPIHCSNNICDPDNGTCLNECNGDYYGPYCSMRQLVTTNSTAKSGSSLNSYWNAPKAIDGCVNTNVFCDCCLHTDQSHNNIPEYLTIDLLRAHTINKVEIYFVKYSGIDTTCTPQKNITLEVQNRSIGYEIFISNGTQSDQKCYKDLTPKASLFKPHQIVTCIGKGRYINITQSHISNGKGVTGPMLEICEVKVYGCIQGYYGDDCQYQCPIHCKDNVCYSNGTCQGCEAGWQGANCSECSNGTYGQNCTSRCGHCKNNAKCDRSNGSCPRGFCDLGFKGHICKEECPNGTFGNNCSNSCGNCRENVCNKQNGRCPRGECQKGFNGTFCNETCPDRTFGYNCKESCGHCRDGGACNKTNGECPEFLCERGFNGSLCNKSCIPGRYGFNCNQSCGHCKDNTACDTRNGFCKQGLCGKGYNGSLCIEECTNGTYGYNCMQKCGACRNRAACVKTNGECPSGLCDRGFDGSFCNETCAKRKYGYNCNETCGHCRYNKACDMKYGYCTEGFCEKGYNGSFCVQECVDGSYGYNCYYSCGKCRDRVVCNKATGECPRGLCGRGVNGSKCDQVCSHGTYGYNCNEKCNVCKDMKCDARDGTCSDAKNIAGFPGLHSEKSTVSNSVSVVQKEFPTSAVIGGNIAAIFVILLIVFTTALWLRKRQIKIEKKLTAQQYETCHPRENEHSYSSVKDHYTSIQQIELSEISNTANSQRSTYINGI